MLEGGLTTPDVQLARTEQVVRAHPSLGARLLFAAWISKHAGEAPSRQVTRTPPSRSPTVELITSSNLIIRFGLELDRLQHWAMRVSRSSGRGRVVVST